jgi:hypothetical protein
VHEEVAAAPKFIHYGFFVMSVRWQKRKRRKPAFGYQGDQIEDPTAPYGFVCSLRSTNKQDTHWVAVLIESVRVDGRPRQRHVAYLDGIADSAIEITAQRAWFWQHVMLRLDRLANRIPNDDRPHVEAAIAVEVPRLTRTEYDECVAAWTALESDSFKFDKPSFESCGEAAQSPGARQMKKPPGVRPSRRFQFGGISDRIHRQ